MLRILFVRAVNVGGAKLPMAEFRELLRSLGGTDVRTYIASGNAVLEVPGDPVAFDRAVEAELAARFGYSREVLSRAPDEVRAALAAHPFEVLEPGFSYVAFLSTAPTPDVVDAVRLRTGDDRWAVDGTHLHLRFAAGAGRAALDLDALLRRLSTIGTARNVRTVQAVLDLAGAP